MNVTLLPQDNAGAQKSTAMELAKKPTLETEKQRLMKAAKNIESLFLFQLLKSMRQTIPENSLSKGFGLSGGLGKDIYTEMFDQELASRMANTSGRSMAEMLYNSMEKLVVAEFNQEEPNSQNINEILPQNNYIKIKSETKEKPIKINPLNSRGKEVSIDKVKLDKTIEEISAKYKLDPDLVRAVIRAESNFDPSAVSKAGAKGLMQLIDTTASDMGVRDVFDPEQNIEGGSKYLRNLLDRFGDLKLALAAYNAGPGTVERYGGIPPYRETQDYVKNVLTHASGGRSEHD